MRLILYSEQKDRLHVFVMWTLKLQVKPNSEISRLVYNSNTSTRTAVIDESEE